MRLSIFFCLFGAIIIFSSCDGGYQIVSGEEAGAMSKMIDSAIRERKPKLFVGLFNLQEIGKRIEKSSSHKFPSSMERGVGRAFERAGIGDQIIQQVAKSGSYQLVRRYEKENVQHLLYRLYSEEGLNYHDFELVKKNGKTAIGDMYIYIAGENLSSLLAGLLDMFDKPTSDAVGKEDETLEHVSRIKELMTKGKNKEAKELFDRLPASVREQKTIAILGILVCSNLDEKIYVEQMNRFQSRYPNDPNTYLLTLDAAIITEDYHKALESIDHLDSLVNKDSFLDYYRALMYNLLKQPVKARKCLEDLTHTHPEFEAGVLELIVNYLEGSDDVLARSLIQNFKKHPEFNQERLRFILLRYPQFEE